jgi:hypothetical protein
MKQNVSFQRLIIISTPTFTALKCFMNLMKWDNVKRSDEQEKIPSNLISRKNKFVLKKTFSEAFESVNFVSQISQVI